MKVHELLKNRLLLESDVTLETVRSLKYLINPTTGEYYTGEVNVIGNVNLYDQELVELPVKFGEVNGYFSCDFNKLKSLEGAPHTVGDSFDCSNNQLTSLESTPHTLGNIYVCNNNYLTSLVGIHKLIKKINGTMYVGNNPIRSGGIGLILIEGLTEIDSELPALRIINKYLGQGKKGLLLCQDELIEAGYEEYARL